MTSLINWFIDVLYSGISAVLLLLPDSPFQEIQTYSGPLSSAFSTIAYFIPIPGMLTLTVAFLGVVIVWYAYRWILRLGRYID